MKAELTITKDYLPEWGIWEGVRELVQNGQDAQTEHQAPFAARHDGTTLFLTNTGATLDREALLMGHTSKLGRKDLIGQFGEGLKLGILALVRAGRKVKIRTGSEVWVPFIAFSAKFNAEVLWFEIHTGRKDNKRVSVEVELSEVEWNEYSKRFVFLADFPEDQRIKTRHGHLLIGPDMKGSLYVKGIFVECDPKLSFGYDYADAKVDRDRQAVRQFDKQWENSRIWQVALSSHPDTLFEHFFNMLREDAPDLAGFDEYAAQGMTSQARDQIYARFVEIHGDNAVPVENLQQSMQLEHLGKKGVIVPKGLRVIIQQKQGNLEMVKGALEKEVLKTYSWHEISTTERANLDISMRLVDHVVRELFSVKIPEGGLYSLVSLVDFRSDSLFGQFKKGRILLAKKILEDREETLATLIHELAHFGGQDGAHGHVALMEKLWKAVARALLDGKVVLDAKKEA